MTTAVQINSAYKVGGVQGMDIAARPGDSENQVGHAKAVRLIRVVS
jgi:hypothetical protein